MILKLQRRQCYKQAEESWEKGNVLMSFLASSVNVSFSAKRSYILFHFFCLMACEIVDVGATCQESHDVENDLWRFHTRSKNK